MNQKINYSRLLGAILLISGTTIGAGILALPISTGIAGFFPSCLCMIFCWLFLTYSAFCILEVTLAVKAKSNLVSMATETLGLPGKVLSWSAYLFLLYALNTAYIAVSTSIFQKALFAIAGQEIAHIFCILPLLLAFSLLLRQGMKVVDSINRMLMIGLVITFVLLLGLSAPFVSLENLTTMQSGFLISSLSIMVTAFGFHIIIPSLVTYLHANVRELKLSIWVGSAIPLVAYLLWQLAIVGAVPMTGEVSIEDAYYKGWSGTDLLSAISPFSFTPQIAQSFALFVILTSFLGVSVSLFDFLADGLKIEKRASGKWMLFFFTFVPPLYFALSYPRAFFLALEYAGAFGVVILLALLPALMVWRKRYVLHLPSSYQVKGGRLGLIALILISLVIIVFEIMLYTT